MQLSALITLYACLLWQVGAIHTICSTSPPLILDAGRSVVSAALVTWESPSCPSANQHLGLTRRTARGARHPSGLLIPLSSQSTLDSLPFPVAANRLLHLPYPPRSLAEKPTYFGRYAPFPCPCKTLINRKQAMRRAFHFLQPHRNIQR
jgi:hypothetical protein